LGLGRFPNYSLDQTNDAGQSAVPTAGWAAQQIIEAFPEETAPRFLLKDRDQIYGEEFRRRVAGMRIEEVMTAPHSPWQSPYVERLISIRSGAAQATNSGAFEGNLFRNSAHHENKTAHHTAPAFGHMEVAVSSRLPISSGRLEVRWLKGTPRYVE